MDDQQKALMDYTKFHIGLYTTLCTVLVGIMGLEGSRGQATPMLPYFLGTLICFAIAGGFGGLIGSSLPEHQTWTAFTGAKLGPWFLPKLIPATWVVSAEHTAFWVGAVIALSGVIKTFMTAAPAVGPAAACVWPHLALW